MSTFDTNTFSLATFVGSVLGSGIISTVIGGVFANIKSDKEWRSSHLSEDKKCIRQAIEDFFNVIDALRDPNDATERNQPIPVLSATVPGADYRGQLEKYINKLELYLDTNNKFSYSMISQCRKVLACFKDFLDTEKEEYHIQAFKLIDELKVTIQSYFIEYYPKQTLWQHIVRAVSCNHNNQ